MWTLVGRNVNDLWMQAVPLMQAQGEPSPSRAGQVLVAPWPVMSVYENPCERVLFDPARDANPFFHFFEALWMLAGRRDAGFLNAFVKDFGQRFAEQDGNIHGAYGHRWRKYFCLDGEHGIDQLKVAIATLRRDTASRQVVISMWDPAGDLTYCPLDWSADSPLENKDLKDRPCNTHIYLRVRQEVEVAGASPTYGLGGASQELALYLDLTVCCRSNDIVWGAYGANAVHFSFLLEYLAGMIEVNVGRMYQFSNNWHAYEDVLNKYMAARQEQFAWEPNDPYARKQVSVMPIVGQWETWDEDLSNFIAWSYDPLNKPKTLGNTWFKRVAKPMWQTHAAHKLGFREDARAFCSEIEADDWRLAVRRWLEKRYAAKEAA